MNHLIGEIAVSGGRGIDMVCEVHSINRSVRTAMLLVGCAIGAVKLVAASDAAIPAGRPTQGQIARLVAAAWEPQPENVDVTFIVSEEGSPVDESRAREIVLRATDRLYENPKFRGDLSPEERESRRQMDAEESLKRYLLLRSQPRQYRMRLQKSPFASRRDRTMSLLGEHLDDQSPYRFSFISRTDPFSGATKGLRISHYHKTCTFVDVGFSGEDPTRYFGLPPAIRAIVQLSTGEGAGGGRAVPSAERVRELVAGTSPDCRLSVERRIVDGMACDVWGVWNPQLNTASPVFLFACREDNYGIVPYVNVYDPQSGQLRFTSRCMAFRKAGDREVPGVITIDGVDPALTERDSGADRNVHRQIVVIDYTSPRAFPEETFSFNAPAGYRVTTSPASHPGERHEADSDRKGSKQRSVWYGVLAVPVFGVTVTGGAAIVYWKRKRVRARKLQPPPSNFSE